MGWIGKIGGETDSVVLDVSVCVVGFGNGGLGEEKFEDFYF